jgi:hypothetical protein
MQAEQAQHAEQAAVPVESVAPAVREERPPVREERPPVREERAPVREAREERHVPPPVPRVEEPRIDPKELLESAGLVMIETDRSKARVQPAVAEEPPPAGRPRRERPKPAAQDESLVQIETRK